jgi:hypothetical protein
MEATKSPTPAHDIMCYSLHNQRQPKSDLVSSCRRQAKRDLERVVDEPLERSKGTNHEDTDRQSVPQAAEANVAVDARNGCAGTLTCLAVAVELRHHDIYLKVSMVYIGIIAEINLPAGCETTAHPIPAM